MQPILTLRPGARIGPYEIVEPLGRGGMGEVYRARDTNLNRNVAVKVLPGIVAADPDQLARLTREAQTLAALNHPQIAQVYGLEGSAVVMELVDGEDLSAMLARGPMPLADALPIARQIADALEAAHEQGIIHRDLKPSNIKVRPDGTVKILDFGLAKNLTGVAAIAGSSAVTVAATEQGVILGTAAYMAPEQARGRPVDKRADIWAFGAVLYEMLTGRRAFQGDGLSDVLAAVLQREVDWSRVPSDTPPPLRHLIERCLTTEVRQRLRDIGEARVTIAAIERGDLDLRPAAMTARRRWREPFAWIVAAVAVLAAAGSLVRRSLTPNPPGSHGIVRLSVLPPTGLVMNPDSANVAISPDGRMVAFVVGVGLSVENQLWVRPLDSPVARRLDGGKGAAQPFWSPDSTRIGFFAERRLKTVSAASGASEIVCDAPFGRGATWNAANVIVFAPDANGPLYRVSANGGTLVPVTTLDASKETGHRFPEFLPDGDHFLFAALPGDDAGFEIFAGSLRNSNERTRIGAMGSAPVYAEPGWLLFVRDGVLAAQPFDARARRITGEAVSLGDRSAVAPFPAAYDAGRRVSASRTGLLAYSLETPVDTRVLWMDQAGNTTRAVSVPAAEYSNVAIAPDGTRAALVRSDSPSTSSIWLVDLARGGAVPLATGGRHGAPVWSPDSTRLAFWSDREGHRGIFEKRVIDDSPERPLLKDENRVLLPRGWAMGDVGILFNRVDPGAKWNVYRLPPSGGAPIPVVQRPSIDGGGWLSPDGRWLAYLSDEAGRLDLYVQAFPTAGAKVQVSDDAVHAAWWSPDGRHLLFLKRDRTLWRVDAEFGAALPHIGAPVKLGAFPSSLIAMDLAAGGRVLALVPERAGVASVTVVQFWRDALVK